MYIGPNQCARYAPAGLGRYVSGKHQLVNWPGIIKHSDDAELVYVSDRSEWDNDADLHCFEYDESEFLIDSSGNIYTLTERSNKYVKPEANGDSISINEILALVKAHAAQKGSCCVSKLYAPTISDALKIVESLNET